MTHQCEIQLAIDDLPAAEDTLKDYQERLRCISHLYPKDWNKKDISPSLIIEREREARALFKIPEDEDLYDNLTRVWETTITDHYKSPETFPSLTVPYAVLAHLGDPPYFDIIAALRDSFAAQNLFLGHHVALGEKEGIRIVFFIEPVGVRHPMTIVPRHTALNQVLGEVVIESLHQVPTVDVVSMCSVALRDLQSLVGDKEFLTPSGGRYSSEDHIIFFTWGISSRHILFVLNTQNGETFLFTQEKASGDLTKIPYDREPIREAFKWLLRF